ncbi:PREDICTED: E2F-associated phosphoprotein-like isoform X2 [Priapulus caudatus]|uniref:E2F-associated phosphoprotein-like isoform X2 n=1 Tax=Priapulus caudatus TaxID=37621 RepID=A0ABM1ENZ5_PRICU|nr:PREDICTED: E2F-associated phosphoprotein-like isoform X2 [Priapulus caudatus]
MFEQNHDYVVHYESDGDRPSSDDDVDTLLDGTPQKKKEFVNLFMGEEELSEDEFEKDMMKELDDTVAGLEFKKAANQKPVKEETSTSSAQQFYDDMYFDSDEEIDGENKLDASQPVEENKTKEKKPRKRHPVIPDEDLLYDPGMDDDDQNWMDEQRQQYLSKNGTKKVGKPVKPLPSSDAVLNCPACMTLLCMDCQLHETYKNQYRAMFVFNCRVDKTQYLKYPSKTRQHRRSLNAEVELESKSDGDVERFHPVMCGVCKTEVAVYDASEVYHFFNVLSSYS